MKEARRVTISTSFQNWRLRETLLVEAVVRLSGKGVTMVLSLPLTLNTHRKGFERFIADI